MILLVSVLGIWGVRLSISRFILERLDLMRVAESRQMGKATLGRAAAEQAAMPFAAARRRSRHHL